MTRVDNNPAIPLSQQPPQYNPSAPITRPTEPDESNQETVWRSVRLRSVRPMPVTVRSEATPLSQQSQRYNPSVPTTPPREPVETDARTSRSFRNLFWDNFSSPPMERRATYYPSYTTNREVHTVHDRVSPAGVVIARERDLSLTFVFVTCVFLLCICIVLL